MILAGRLLKVANSLLLAACTAASATMDGCRTVRLPQIAGDAGQTNDVVFCGCRCPADSNVIFFTGDVQVRWTTCYEQTSLAFNNSRVGTAFLVYFTSAAVIHGLWMNRFLTGQGPCRANLHRWGLAQSPSCDCGQWQTMNHIVDTYPLTKFEKRTESTAQSGLLLLLLCSV